MTRAPRHPMLDGLLDLPAVMGEALAEHDAAALALEARADAAASAATEAVWATVAAAFPEASTGDLDPGPVAELELAVAAAVAAWVEANVAPAA